MSNQEHLKIHISEFNFTEFLHSHHDDFVIFASGSCDYTNHVGSYQYTTFYQRKFISRFSELHNLKSPDVAMLLAVKDACEHIGDHTKNIFIVSPTRLGFHMAKKGKGANVDLVNEIMDICNQKALKINTLAIPGGSELFKEIRKKFPPKAASTI